MIRKTCILLLAISSGLFALLWMVSWLTPLYVVPYDNKADFVAIAGDMGELVLEYSRKENGPMPKPRVRLAMLGVSWQSNYGMRRGGPVRFMAPKCHIGRMSRVTPTRPTPITPPTYRADDTVRIRLLLISFLLAIVPFAHAGLACRHRTLRYRRGLCVGCAYDLRGDVSGICPECGRTIAKRHTDKPVAS